MDARETAPAAERNKQPILEVLARVLPPRGLVLEIGSGTGQHIAHFAKALPLLTFQPSEMDVERHASIAAWTGAASLPNVKPPLAIDVTKHPWPVSAADAVLCINVIHIAPWEATRALMAGASIVLPAGGALVTYGPYKRGGAHTSQSNEAFDASLRARNPAWGVRDIEKVAEIAGNEGLALEEVIPMPANNFTLVWRKATSAVSNVRALPNGSGPTRRHGGTGLGLALTRRIAELMGGTVGVESVLGAAGTFWFTARLQKVAAATAVLGIVRALAARLNRQPTRV